MPCLRIETNVSKSSFNHEQMSKELLAALAKTLGKPIGYCMVVIVPDTLILTGADAGKLKKVIFFILKCILVFSSFYSRILFLTKDFFYVNVVLIKADYIYIISNSILILSLII